MSLILHTDQLRPLCRETIAPEVLGKALLGQFDDRIRGRQDRLCRAVIAVQRNDLCRWAELRWKIENVADRGGAEGVDGLRIVADDSQSATIRPQALEDRTL